MRTSLEQAMTLRARRAFTLVELLVVVAVTAVLIALRLPALARAERGTKIAHCASNLRAFDLAAQIYAADNGDKLPSNTDASGSTVGNWPWDLARKSGDQLARFGLDWRKMYCPGTAPRFNDSVNFQLYNFGTGVIVTGYGLTFPGIFGLASSNLNSTLTPPLMTIGFGVSMRPRTSERVLLADATISEAGQSDRNLIPFYNFTRIVGGTSLVLLSPHLSGQFPLGGNLAMLDGHVEWRSFKSMNPRTDGFSPVFWW